MNTASFIVNVIGTIATAGAAWLAYVTIRQSKAASAENELALIRERRIDFELRVLADLATLIRDRPPFGVSNHGKIIALTLMLPSSLIPMTRNAYSRVVAGATLTDDHRTAMLEEILGAIQEKFDQRELRGQAIGRRR